MTRVRLDTYHRHIAKPSTTQARSIDAARMRARVMCQSPNVRMVRITPIDHAFEPETYIPDPRPDLIPHAEVEARLDAALAPDERASANDGEYFDVDAAKFAVVWGLVLVGSVCAIVFGAFLFCARFGGGH